MSRTIQFTHYLMVILLSIITVSGCDKPQDKSLVNNPLQSLADTSGEFELPNKKNKITFPQAHAPHKSYRQEWWYLTANLTAESGQVFATQWTLFRRAVEQKHWYFAHAALADRTHHLSAYRDGREELGNVVINATPFDARIDDWRWRADGNFLPAQLSYGSHVIDENKQKFGNVRDKSNWQVKLNLSEQLQYFLQGEQGFSQKHHRLNIASHYYSQPFIDVNGELFWQGEWHKVTGKAWLDREWGSQMLAQDQQGWDWFSLRLDENTALMVYRIRSTEQDYLYGSIMKQGGQIRTLSVRDVELLQVTKNSASEHGYPQAFTISIAKEDIAITVEVVNTKQIMRFGIEYFEGMVTFSGSHQGKGFLEMTGYQ